MRKLTPKECLRLQGFPEDFNFLIDNIVSRSNQYKQIGNTVSIPVVTAIAKNIKKTLLT
ncbi:DNA cytosine methyltransferase [Geminocystis sp. GBBB08]|uniref:DNA cytosine methyltransferase n=1 Tax=Geminocystis sp. GBBB08 TaxID=2604140 RepID=UPI0027E22016|nr:DNA cytosine methyltransferase [Geminocystis sp. GBBB08]